MSTINRYKNLGKTGIRANLKYFQTRMDRLRQEIRELEFQYHMNISMYLWMIDHEGDTDATPDRPTAADGRADD